jgi:menaquinone-specific isochorismate synthase
MMFRPATIDAVAGALSGPEDRLRVAIVDLPHGLSPLAMVRAAAPGFGSAYSISTPNGTEVGGVGVARRFGAGGPGRFERLRDDLASQSLPGRIRLFLGYSFSPDGPVSEQWSGFDSASVVLPQLTAVRSEDGDYLVAALPAGADRKRLIEVMLALQPGHDPLVPDPGDHAVESHPSSDRWREEVGEAVAAIRAGALRKVVLARSVEVRSHSPIDGLDLVHHLGKRHPQCYNFGWQSGGATFVGASPELLVAKRGNQIRSNPLAGTDRRGTGDEEDRAVGAALMSSAKNRSEHALVIDDVADRLSTITSSLEVPLEPSVRRIASVQHLSTEIRGTLSGSQHLLDVVGLLHPTPAVGGTPRTDAVGFIDKVEEIDRGWYSGGIGWMSPNGDGDVNIALRCGLVRGTTARVFAGSGIVGSSDPEAELAETRLKLRPLLDLLTAR